MVLLGKKGKKKKKKKKRIAVVFGDRYGIFISSGEKIVVLILPCC